jgi:hypothetical protein
LSRTKSTATRDLDASNDLEYLLGLIGDGLGDGDYEDDTARAKCAVAEWCRAIGYVPDIDSYESGQTTPPDDMRDEVGGPRRDGRNSG